ncbi:MAG: KH domain-containing protein [Flavonifractor plautii]
MGAEARPVIRMDENGTYQVELVGRELGGLIGRRGETLDAIQQLTGYAVNHGQSKRVRIHVDAEGYRAKREESLVRLAQQGGR